MRLLWKMNTLFMVVGLLAICGCELDELPGPEPGDIADPIDPENELLCEAEFSLSGNLMPSGDIPPEEDGCVPFGTWLVKVELQDPGDCGDVVFDEVYNYQVSGDAEGAYSYQYPADPNSSFVSMKVTAGGPGDCLGSFEHYSTDGKRFILLKPVERDLLLTGRGYYELYSIGQL